MISSLKCAIIPLILVVIATFFVYWTDQAAQLIEPVWAMLLGAIRTLAMLEQEFFDFIAGTATWAFLRDYVFIPFGNIAFLVYMPMFLVTLTCACAINRTKKEDRLSERFKSICKVYRAITNALLVFLFLYVFALICMLDKIDAPVSVNVITVLMLIEIVVIAYTERKNGNILAWDFKHAE
jgi:hypothetical protein